MNHPLEKLYQASTTIKLSSNEKHTMHARLLQAMDASAPVSAAPARSSRGLYYFMSPQFVMPLAALLVIVLGTTTAYASEASLPGDPLYAIKTKVNEPIQGALAFSIEDKIKFHSEVAQTRVEEAEVLASQNRLDATSSQQIEQSIDDHIAQRDTLTSELTEKNPDAAAKVSAELNTSISAHSDVLVALGQGSTSAATREHSDAIAMQVRSSSHGRSSFASGARPVLAIAMAEVAPQAQVPKMATTMSVTFNAEDSAATGSSEEASSSPNRNRTYTPAAAKIHAEPTRQEQQASSSLAALKVRINKLTTLDEDTRARLDARLAKIDAYLADGNTNDALDAIVTLSTFISASVKFDHNILGNLLDNNSEGGEGGDN